MESIKKLLPDNIMNSGYLQGNKYFTKEMEWANSLLIENGMPNKSEVIVYIKKIEIPSLNRTEKTLVVSYIIPYSDRHSKRSNKIEFEFNSTENKYLFETINLTRNNLEPIPLPPM